jgi:hypothetical protein
VFVKTTLLPCPKTNQINSLILPDLIIFEKQLPVKIVGERKKLIAVSIKRVNQYLVKTAEK